MPAVFWLAMQVAMSAGFAIAAPTGGQAGALDGGLDSSVWICTPFGPRLMALDAAEAGGDPGVSGAGCYWCQGFGAAPAPGAPPSVDGPAVFAAAALPPKPGVPDRVRSRNAAPFQSRAPPL